MKKKRKFLVVCLFLFLFFVSSRIWARIYPTILYPKFKIPVEQVGPHTFQGWSIIFLLFVFFYFITNAGISTLVLLNAILAVFFFANKIKFLERGEIINFNELSYIFNLKELSQIVSLEPFLIAIALCGLVLIGTGFLDFKIIKHGYKAIKEIRLIGVTLVLMVFSPMIVDSEKFVYKYFQLDKPNSVAFAPLQKLQTDGFIPSFIKGVSMKYMDEPTEFSHAKIAAIKKEYQKIAAKENKQKSNDLKAERTIIYLSESFWQDQLLVTNGLPAPYIASLSNQYGGSMYSQYIGGGTANIEYSVLTSMSLELHKNANVVTPYVDYFPDAKTKASILSLVPKKERMAVHPFTFGLYNRVSMYEKMGISHLIDEEKMQHKNYLPFGGRILDESFHLELIDRLPKGRMINALSMQNHSPYYAETSVSSEYQPVFKEGVLSKKDDGNEYGDFEGRATTYFKQIRATDGAVQSFIGQLDQMQEPINVVFYGDHGPSFLRGKEHLLSADDIHRTPYFIYQNMGRNQATKQKNQGMSPIFLVPELLERGNYKRPPFYYLMSDLYKAGVERIGPDYVYVTNKRVLDKDLPTKVKQLVLDYRILAYDRFFKGNVAGDAFYTKY